MSSVTVNYSLDYPLDERRELAQRTADGIEVVLLWCQVTEGLSVVVYDERSGRSFELAVETGAEALDAFHHPFAHAAWRGVDYDSNGGSHA
jgi:hypothetical protein